MDIFNTTVLNRVVDSLDQPASFLLDLFFPGEQTEDTADIHFDVEKDKPRITPFVHPMKAGKVVQNQGYETKVFQPAYAKDKRHFDPSQPLKRMIGEQIGGTMSPQQRRNLALQFALRDQLRMLTRREEVMASEALLLGQVTVTGDGYPTKVVDFQRHNDLTVALAGGAQWGETDVHPLDDLEAWAGDVQAHSGGVATTVVFDPKAWAIFRKHPDVQKLLDTRRGSTSQAETGPIARGQGSRKARHVGMIGDFDVWVYQDAYVDDAGAVQQLLPDNTVIMGDPANTEGVRAYGAIQDEKAGYQARRFFSKSWLEEDPAVRWLMLQSAPLVVPYRTNATLSATVRA